MTAVLSDQNFGSNTTQVEAALKKHEAIAADIEARVSPETDLLRPGYMSREVALLRPGYMTRGLALLLFCTSVWNYRLPEIIYCPEIWNMITLKWYVSPRLGSQSTIRRCKIMVSPEVIWMEFGSTIVYARLWIFICYNWSRSCYRCSYLWVSCKFTRVAWL